MAMDKRGAPRQFPFTLEQTQKLFAQYKLETMENIIIRPCWPDFLTRNGISIEEAKEVINNPVDTNKNLSIYLKKALDWCTSQLMTHPGWGGNHAVKAIYLSKQDFGGTPYSDRQDISSKSDVTVKVNFGGKSKDPFG